jgi:hypothetical protein
MPTVPLYNNGQQPLNMTGVRVPVVAQNVAAGPAVGQGLADLGSVGLHVAGQMQHAENTRNIADAHGVMQQHAAEQQLFQAQNPDQNTWLPAWQKRVDSMQNYVNGLDVSGQAREAIAKGVNQWANSGGINVQLQAAQQSKQRAITSVGTQMGLAAQEGNDGRIHAAAPLLDGLVTPEDKEAMIQQYLQQSKTSRIRSGLQDTETAQTNNQPETARAHLEKLYSNGDIPESEYKLRMSGIESAKLSNDLVGLSRSNPWEAKQLADQHYDGGKGKLDASQWIAVHRAADQQIKVDDTNETDVWNRLIQAGVGNKEEALRLLNENRKLLPQSRQDLINLMNLGPVNDPVTYASLYAEAKNFDGKEGSPEYSRFLSRVDMTLKDDQKNSVLSTLNDSVKGNKDGSAKAKAAIYSQMADDLKAGLFGDTHGSLDRPNAILPPNIRAAVDTIKGGLMLNEKVSPEEQKKPDVQAKYERMARVKWWDNQPDKQQGEHFNAYMVEDEGLKHAASDRAWSAMASLEKWMADNPKSTPQEARAYYDSLLVRQRAVGGLGTLLPKHDYDQQIIPPESLEELRKKYGKNFGK